MTNSIRILSYCSIWPSQLRRTTLDAVVVVDAMLDRAVRPVVDTGPELLPVPVRELDAIAVGAMQDGRSRQDPAGVRVLLLAAIAEVFNSGTDLEPVDIVALFASTPGPGHDGVSADLALDVAKLELVAVGHLPLGLAIPDALGVVELLDAAVGTPDGGGSIGHALPEHGLLYGVLARTHIPGEAMAVSIFPMGSLHIA